MKHPQPFFRRPRKRWVVQLDGKQINLGPDEDAAWERYFRLMAERGLEPVPKPVDPIPHGIPTVAAVIDAYCGWLKGRVSEGSKAQRTLDWYRKYLASFLRFLRSIEPPPSADPKEPPSIMADQLEPLHVYRWVDAQPGWKTGKRGAIVAVQRAFNWAARAGHLKSIGGRSPLAALEKPPQGRREQLVSEAEYREVRGLVRDEEFRDLLELSWETGCRPHELFNVEVSYVDLANARWVFPIRLSKGKKVQRVVYLTDRALEITQRLVLKRLTGPLLLNTEGVPWCVSSVKCRFQKLCRALGRTRLGQSGVLPPMLPRLNADQRKDKAIRATHEAKVGERRCLVNRLAKQHGTRYNLYAFRHSMITEALVNGVDAVTVSVLAGHRDTTMLSRHYAHLTQKHEHMRRAANRARATGS